MNNDSISRHKNKIKFHILEGKIENFKNMGDVFLISDFALKQNSR